MSSLNVRGEELHAVLKGREPARVFEIFDAVRRIPRESKKEGHIRKFLIEWAETYGFVSHVDAAGNLSIKIPATLGYEDAPAVCMQGHMDMVYTQVDGGDPDFVEQPIDLEVLADERSEWLRSKGTTRTLGADNAAGFTVAMAAATDPSTVHGPVELLFTVDEETGLEGAEHFHAAEHGMESKVLINLDTPIGRTIAVACAGWSYVEGRLPIERQAADQLKDGTYYTVSLRNLEGGHSGDDLAKNRGNANKELAALISLMPAGSRIARIEGGEKSNSIPANAKATIFVPGNKQDTAWHDALASHVDALRTRIARPEVQLVIEEISGTGAIVSAMTDVTHSNILNATMIMPDGIQKMSAAAAGVPELSNTLAQIQDQEGKAFLNILVRGADAADVDAHAAHIGEILARHDFDVQQGSKGPGFNQDPHSPIIEATVEAYRAVIGDMPQFTAFHSTVESGLLAGDPAHPNFTDTVSIGSTVLNEHGVNESWDLHSLQETYKVVQELLRIVAVKKLKPVSALEA